MAHFAHLVEVLELGLVESRVTLMATEEAKGWLIGRLLAQERQELMNLLIVGHVVLCEHALNLLKVPVGNSWHFVDLVNRAAIVPVLTVRPVYTEAISVVVALPV